MDINGHYVVPGTQKIVRIPVAKIPSGMRIGINVFVFRSIEPGPTVLVMGGVHGDEINGVEIVRRAIAQNLFENLRKGTVIAIPLLNVYGFINFSREAHDGKDVNRSFPGSLRGSLSSRVARTLTKKILPLVDFGVDFHTGAESRFNYPQIRYSKNDPASFELAKQFAAPVLLEKATIRKSLRDVALKQNKPILVYEGGESLRFDGLSIEKGFQGIRNLLSHQGMLEANPSKVEPLVFKRSVWLRAAHPGIFCWSQESGKFVNEGEILGVINDPYGTVVQKVRTKKAGFLIGHNNVTVVSQGDPLFHIAFS